MTKGTIFDIKQMAVFDGPGLRTTVFLKGCPLRCRWCHNPEGLSPSPELMVSDNGCLHCGRCRQVCGHPESCTLCGRCIRACPLHLRKIAGTEWTAADLAGHLKKDADILTMNGGGITLSGGEPTLQADFVLELLPLLKPLHRAMETCVYCPPDIFAKILAQLDYVLMDIKLADPSAHRLWTGCDNAMILKNLEQVKQSRKPFIIRIPLIPGVSDTESNLESTAALLTGCDTLKRVELLPYHQTDGAKYPMVRRRYVPQFDPDRPVRRDTSAFDKLGIPVRIL